MEHEDDSGDEIRSVTNASEELEDDTFKILLATDCHLGYEQTTKRTQTDDSFITFEEILQYAVEYDVDFILFGGDLFHDSKPSQGTILRCLNLLRKYCLGSREIKMQFLTDPDVNFDHCDNKCVNFEDPNLNVSIPIFSIHGNHDDPSSGGIGSMDLLASTGLINYFGKWTNLTNVEIAPLVLKKGETKVALYGLSYMNDQRLSRLLRDEKVNLMDLERVQGYEDCFQIMVLHQNRVKHSEYGYIPESMLPQSLNLIMWGHEHECRIEPEPISSSNVKIIQPGSSVATSLCPGEQKPKHVGLLSVHKQTFKLKKLKLKTVRPFVFKDISLKDEDINRIGNISENVYNFIDDYIEKEMLPEVIDQLTGHKFQPATPLIRLRVTYKNDNEMFDKIRLTPKYCEVVANPLDLLLWKKERVYSTKKYGKQVSDDDEDDGIWSGKAGQDNQQMQFTTVQERMKHFFSIQKNKSALTVLSVNGLNEALTRFVNKDDNNAFEDVIKHQIKQNVEFTAQHNVQNRDEVLDKFLEFQDIRLGNQAEEEDEINKVLNDKSRDAQRAATANADEEMFSDEDGLESSSMSSKGSKRGRGATRSRARGKRVAGRGRGRGAARDDGEEEEILISDDDSDSARPKSARGRSRGRPNTSGSTRSRGRAASTATKNTPPAVTRKAPIQQKFVFDDSD